MRIEARAERFPIRGAFRNSLTSDTLWKVSLPRDTGQKARIIS